MRKMDQQMAYRSGKVPAGRSQDAGSGSEAQPAVVKVVLTWVIDLSVSPQQTNRCPLLLPADHHHWRSILSVLLGPFDIVRCITEIFVAVLFAMPQATGRATTRDHAASRPMGGSRWVQYKEEKGISPG